MRTRLTWIFPLPPVCWDFRHVPLRTHFNGLGLEKAEQMVESKGMFVHVTVDSTTQEVTRGHLDTTVLSALWW